MNVTFTPLDKSHFQLMLKWLESPHVKKWWDEDIIYTLDVVKEKYGSYIHGYKQINGINRPISAFIIFKNSEPIGYIQIYNMYDFPPLKLLLGLPENLGAFDIFIGEEKYLGKGMGSTAIIKFLDLYGGSVVNPISRVLPYPLPDNNFLRGRNKFSGSSPRENHCHSSTLCGSCVMAFCSFLNESP